MNNSIPKSLHTVTVIVAIARQFDDPAMSPKLRVREALKVLGYTGTADPYGLAARAVAILTR